VNNLLGISSESIVVIKDYKTFLKLLQFRVIVNECLDVDAFEFLESIQSRVLTEFRDEVDSLLGNSFL
jgi:hypothetical protein